MKGLSRVEKDSLQDLPHSPGVYYFLNQQDKVLYVGRATNLRSRVSSYFYGDMMEKRGPLVANMIPDIDHIGYRKTDSVLEAVVLEAYEIKRIQPPHNTKDKSQKSFSYLIITDEDFPRLLIKRGKEIYEGKVRERILYSFGPFSSRKILEEALKIIRRIFPFHTKRGGYADTSSFYKQIGLAPGRETRKKEYRRNIQNIRLFFEGKKEQIIKALEKEMAEYAKQEEFEKAADIRNKLFSLRHIKDVSLIQEDELGVRGYRVEAYDVAHMQGSNLVGVMTVVEAGEVQKDQYRKFNIKSFSGVDDTRALRELLERRFAHLEWAFPQMIVADGGVAQKRVVEKFLHDNNIANIAVVSCKKNKQHKVEAILGQKSLIEKHQRSILLANSEAHRFAIDFHKLKRGKSFLP